MTTYPSATAAPAAPVRRQVRRANAPKDTPSRREPQREHRPAPDVDQVLEDSFPASDPPSWTGSISRVANVPARQQSIDRLMRRIRAEFREMPGLSLTITQAQRLWSVEPRICEAVLTSLIDSRFLRRTDRGLFVLRRP